MVKKIVGGIIAVIAIAFICSLSWIIEDVDNNQIVVNQYPWTGEMAYWTQPGVKMQWFGQTTTYYKTHQVWFNEIDEEKDGSFSTLSKINPAFPITYSDKGKGYVLGSVRIELPLREDKLDLIQKHYGSERRLIEELIKPTLGKAILASGPLMTSLESVSEKRNDLLYYITDQLNNGIYSTKAVTVEKLNSITGDVEKIQQAEMIVDSLGNVRRSEESPFDKYGLKVSQLAIADLKYEAATNNQISKQREADMQIITAKAEAARAVQAAITAEKEGEAKAAKAKWEEEETKARAVVKAEQEFEVAALNAKKAEEEAKKILAEGRAAAEANRLKVQAGLTPQEKAEWDYKTTVGVAAELKDYKGELVPAIMVVGGNGTSSAANAMDAVGFKMFNDLVKDIRTKN